MGANSPSKHIKELIRRSGYLRKKLAEVQKESKYKLAILSEKRAIDWAIVRLMEMFRPDDPRMEDFDNEGNTL